MLVSVLGSTDFEKIAKLSGKKKEGVKRLYADVGEALARAGVELLIVPDAALLVVADSYKKAGGKKVIGVVPRQDRIWGIKHLEPNLRCLDEEISDADWLDVPYLTVSKPDKVVCVTVSSGVLCELAYVKWLKKFGLAKKKVIVFKNFLRSGRLPAELEADIGDLVTYVDSTEAMIKALG
jgi:hypothetical protein